MFYWRIWALPLGRHLIKVCAGFGVVCVTLCICVLSVSVLVFMQMFGLCIGIFAQ